MNPPWALASGCVTSLPEPGCDSRIRACQACSFGGFRCSDRAVKLHDQVMDFWMSLPELRDQVMDFLLGRVWFP